MVTETTFSFPSTLLARWPSPLAAEWLVSYPQLFEQHDFAQTQSQPNKHFVEWMAAVQLHHRDGVHALVEKYGYGNHPRKIAVVDRLLGPGAEVVRSLHARHKVQPPDLLVYATDFSTYWFVEAKGPENQLRPAQETSYEILQAELGATIEIVHFTLSSTESAR